MGMRSLDADCLRAMRRLVAGPKDPNRWVFEKTWDLNPSRSKRLTLGFDLLRKLDICTVIESPSGLGVKLSVLELQHLLTPSMRTDVFEHLDRPQAEGGVSSRAGNMEFQCVTLRNGEPGLRLAKGESFVILGEVSCTALYYAAPAILQRLDLLDSVGELGAEWLVRSMEVMRAQARSMGQQALSREKEVYPVMTALSGKLGSVKLMAPTLDIEGEFISDMLFRHKELFARMFIDYMRSDDGDVNAESA
ncbi:uncharacterized protein LOC117641482 [Thrips palmi]|uniref:Uncharacterized protein LOC117641482 n=1 Tax=Thrips palmi TaxID=161013 RepID=A0A6P8YD08_THRPL|nr:uncharacterized protein LOC117641482 [Thrips palmi]